MTRNRVEYFIKCNALTSCKVKREGRVNAILSDTKTESHGN